MFVVQVTGKQGCFLISGNQVGEAGLNLVGEVKSKELSFEHVKFTDRGTEIHVHSSLKFYCFSPLLNPLSLNAVSSQHSLISNK